tara:strand:+ start:1699 stop:2028 length:330 start_codon:yes stop_codon:yes gene_type:complete
MPRSSNVRGELRRGIPFKDGILSVQASVDHYSIPRANDATYVAVEVAYIKNDKFAPVPGWDKVYDDDVYPTVNISKVIDTLLDQYDLPTILSYIPPVDKAILKDYVEKL